MPNINDVFPSKYIKAHELQGREPVVAIDRVAMEAIGRSRDLKPVVYFKGKEKGLVLNKTIANKITEIAGSAITEDWTGVRVKLYATEADFGGDTFDVVRIKSANGTQKMQTMTPKPPPPPVAPVVDDAHDDILDDSDIPFAWLLPILLPLTLLGAVFA